MNTSSSPLSLASALYLEAVLPALGCLAPHDPGLRAALAGPDVAVALLAPGGVRARVAVQAGSVNVSRVPRAGDLRLWFPSEELVVRAFTNRPTFAVPLTQWWRLPAARRLMVAGKRLETLLEDRAAAQNDPALARLQVFGNLAVGVAGASCWLRRHADGARWLARTGGGVAVFGGENLPATIWLDLDDPALAWGSGEPPRAPAVRVWFRDVPTALAEIDHRQDSLAALGRGDIRIAGRLPLAEILGWITQQVSHVLHPAAPTSAPPL